jgi:LPPG:FO 2-phospho-L-lactate transferase
MSNRLGVKSTLLPMTEASVQTRVETSDGEISFQEFFVKFRWQPEVKRTYYAGVEASRAAPGVLEAIAAADQIIICPSNPVTSIGPILAVPGIRDALKAARAEMIAVSPIIGSSAVSGPAAKLMQAHGFESSTAGVATLYRDFLDTLIIDHVDEHRSETIRELGVMPLVTSIIMNSLDDKRRLAREVLAWQGK